MRQTRSSILARSFALIAFATGIVIFAIVGLRPILSDGAGDEASLVLSGVAGVDVVTDAEVAADGVAENPSKSTALVVKAEQTDTKLQRELASYVSTLAGTYGVAAYDFGTGRTVRINDDRFFPSASLYKLIVLHQAYDEIARGRLSLNDSVPITRANLQEDESSDLALGDQPTVSEALQLMVTISSNTAAHALLDRLGRDEFNATAAKLGLKETQTPSENGRSPASGWRRYMASTSPRDMLRFFQLLGGRELVDPAASDAMLAVLLEQQINDRIPAGLPPGVRVAHKTGELDGVRNDAGIVLTDHGAYVIVVLSQDADEDEATAAIAEIARRVHASFGVPAN